MYRLVSSTSKISRCCSTSSRFSLSLFKSRNFSAHSAYRNVQTSLRDAFGLHGRNFVITGGGQGIGFAISRAICSVGGNVAILDLRDEPVEEYSQLSSEFGVKTEYIQTDVTNKESLNAAFEKAVSELGSLHGLVPAAGITVDKPFIEQTWEEVNRIQQVNIMGTFFATQLATKQMLKQGTPGSIVMIASICAKQIATGHKLAAYYASKGGVYMLSRALAVELAPNNIRFNTISPGYVETDMTRNLRQQYPHLVEVMQKCPPMKRIGTPDDLTPAVIYLLSDASAYTTGTDIEITGGLHVGRIEANSIT